MTAAILLSFGVAAAAAAIDAALGLPIAYALARGRFPGRRALEALLMAPLVLPPTVTGYLLLLLFGPRGILGKPLRLVTGWSVPFSPGAAVLAAAVVAFPLFLRAARAALEAVPEATLRDARALGLGPLRRALRVALPLARRGLEAGLALAFGRAFGEFGATLMLAGDIPGRTQTLALAVFDAAAQGEDGRAAWLCLGMAALALGVLGIAAALEREDAAPGTPPQGEGRAVAAHAEAATAPAAAGAATAAVAAANAAAGAANAVAADATAVAGAAPAAVAAATAVAGAAPAAAAAAPAAVAAAPAVAAAANAVTAAANAVAADANAAAGAANAVAADANAVAAAAPKVYPTGAAGLRAVRLEAHAGPFRLGPIDLEFPAGTRCVLLGPSGAGKTTLLRALAGLVRATGSVAIGGVPCEGIAPERRPLGWVPQGGGLFPHLSARGNVELVRVVGAPSADALLACVGAAALARRAPAQLSGGETLRVALARALARLPRVLLLDEPFAAIDRASQAPLLALLSELADGGATILEVTHDAPRALEGADLLAVLDEGRLVGAGRPRELFSRPLPHALRRALDADNVLVGVFEPGAAALATFRTASLELPLQLPTEVRGPGYVLLRAEAVGLSRNEIAHGVGPSATARRPEEPPSAAIQGVARSTRNRIPTSVASLAPEGTTARVVLACGLEARVTLAAARELALAPGVAVTAEVKATALRALTRRPDGADLAA